MDITSQELQHSTKNFVKIAGDCLVEETLLCRSMVTWPRHIEPFEQQYENAFTKDPLFGADLVDTIHK